MPCFKVLHCCHKGRLCVGTVQRAVSADVSVDGGEWASFTPQHGQTTRTASESLQAYQKNLQLAQQMTTDGSKPQPQQAQTQPQQQESDPKELEKLIDKIINDNEDKVKEYKEGKEKLFGFFVGQVMKISGGKANPKLANEILKDKLSK